MAMAHSDADFGARRSGTVHERLFEEAATRRARMREEAEGAELRGCTFKPQVRVDPGVAAELWSTPHTVLVHMCLLALPVQVSNRARSLQVSGDRLDMMYREGKSKLYAKRHAQVRPTAMHLLPWPRGHQPWDVVHVFHVPLCAGVQPNHEPGPEGPRGVHLPPAHQYVAVRGARGG